MPSKTIEVDLDEFTTTELWEEITGRKDFELTECLVKYFAGTQIPPDVLEPLQDWLNTRRLTEVDLQAWIAWANALEEPALPAKEALSG